MKYLFKHRLSLLFFVLGLGYTRTLVAQDKTYNWQLGLGIGYTTYYGDLSNYRIHGVGELYKIYRFGNYNSYYQHQPSLSILLQKKITPTLGIMFQANYLQFSMSDRYRKNNGALDTLSSNFSRSLNFQNTMQDVGIAFTFSPNNGRIGSETAFFYPSFYVGAGISKFMVKGDLYDAKNSPYNYRLSGNINDGNYETNLRDQRTETDNKFRNVEPYIDLGLALNFRINSLLTIALQSDIKYSGSDYLDDVSGIYKTSYPTAAEAYAAKPGYNVVDPLTRQRGDNNGVNDFYINNRVVLNISLSRKKATKTFISPVIYALGTPYVPQKKVADTTGKRKLINTDSVMHAKGDSLYVKSDSSNKVFKDSLMKMQLLSPKIATDSTVIKQLDHINIELKDIKEILREQQIKPRLQQLQYQTDSIKNLRVKILNQHPASREGNLLLRVYDLQIDSLRNEYEKAQLKSNRPMSKGDSAVLFDNSFRASPVSPLKSEPVRPAVVKNTNDSIAAYNNYLRRIDSIQNRLNQIEKAAPVRENLQQSSTENAQKIIIDSVTNTRKKDEATRKLKQQDETIASLRQEQKSANDSIDYYKRLRETPEVITSQDTIKKKIPWYQRYLGIGRKKKNQLAADTTTIENYALQQKYYESEAALAKSKIEKAEKDKSDMALQRLNEARENKILIDSIEYVRNLALVQNRIDQNAATLSSMRIALQKSNDSSTYYQKLLLESQQNTDKENNTGKKWYQKVFTSKRKEQDRVDAESAVRQQSFQQQRVYDEEARNLQNRVTDLERSNNELKNSYQSYNDDRSYRRRYDVPVTPVVVYGGDRTNDKREIDDLRAQLQNLQNELNYDARGRQLVTDSSKTDTLRMQQSDSSTSPKVNAAVVAPAAPVTVGDTSELKTLREELDHLKVQLDSMRKTRESTTGSVQNPATPIQGNTRYDVASFPVISVYFKSGAIALSPDQLNKITPLGKIATKNNEAEIILKGFTDAVGSIDKNKIIANKRSGYIKNLLITKYKIADIRIAIEEPEVGQSGSSGKANPLDRRVDLQFR